MNADELIAALQTLSPEQRRLQVVGYNEWELLCDVVGVKRIELEAPFDDEKGEVANREALTFTMTGLESGEWVSHG